MTTQDGLDAGNSLRVALRDLRIARDEVNRRAWSPTRLSVKGLIEIATTAIKTALELLGQEKEETCEKL